MPGVLIDPVHWLTRVGVTFVCLPVFTPMLQVTMVLDISGYWSRLCSFLPLHQIPHYMKSGHHALFLGLCSWEQACQPRRLRAAV